MIGLTKIWLRMCIFNFLTVILKLFLGTTWTSRHSRILLIINLYVHILFYDKIHANILRDYI